MYKVPFVTEANSTLQLLTTFTMSVTKYTGTLSRAIIASQPAKTAAAKQNSFKTGERVRTWSGPEWAEVKRKVLI